MRHAISCALGIEVPSLVEAGVSMSFREAIECGVPMKICVNPQLTHRDHSYCTDREYRSESSSNKGRVSTF